MLHVDDGQLHAYLDGELENLEPGATARLEAHLAACPACTARLADARRSRDRAIDILRAAEPAALPLPAFEAVERRPRRPHPRPDHHRTLQRRATALAWAASLVIALAAGWIARDLQFNHSLSVASREIQVVDMSRSASAPEPAGPPGVEMPRLEEGEVAAGAARVARPEADAAAQSGPSAVMAGVPLRARAATAAVEAGEEAPASARQLAVREAPSPAPPATPPAALPAQRSETAADRARPAPLQDLPADPRLAAAEAPSAKAAPASAAAAETVVAQGRVTTASGAALADAQVAIPSLRARTLTRADGSYSLTLPPEQLDTAQDLTITVHSTGFRPESQPVDFARGAVATADFRLEPAEVTLEAIVVTGTTAGAVRRREAADRAVAAAPAPQARGVASFADFGGNRCSLAVLPLSREPDATFFTARATPDTAVAGSGALEYSRPPARLGEHDPRELFGQVVEVERAGGSRAREIEQAFTRNRSRQAVVVPWEFDPACRPSPWRSSARWVQPGQVAFFTVRLRARQHWVDGMPTFDAFLAGTLPYPLGVVAHRGTGGPAGFQEATRLTADQYFELYQALPTWADLASNPERATAALWRWERANPELAQRYPAIEILAHARAAMDRAAGRSE